MFFSYTSYAKASPEPVGNEAKMLELVEEKREIIQQLQNSNTQLEAGIDLKGNELEKLLTRLENNSKEPSEQFITEFNAKLGILTKDIIEFDVLDSSITQHLETGNSQIAAKNYTEGIKHLDMAIDALKKEHSLLIELGSTIDDTLKLLETL